MSHGLGGTSVPANIPAGGWGGGIGWLTINAHAAGRGNGGGRGNGYGDAAGHGYGGDWGYGHTFYGYDYGTRYMRGDASDGWSVLQDSNKQTTNKEKEMTDTQEITHPLIGTHAIIRGDRSGVFFGVIESLDPAANEVVLTDVRHIWRWAGSANTAELAAHGVGKPKECKFVAAGKILIWDVVEVIPCSPAAVESLSAVPPWEECS